MNATTTITNPHYPHHTNISSAHITHTQPHHTNTRTRQLPTHALPSAITYTHITNSKDSTHHTHDTHTQTHTHTHTHA